MGIDRRIFMLAASAGLFHAGTAHANDTYLDRTTFEFQKFYERWKLDSNARLEAFLDALIQFASDILISAAGATDGVLAEAFVTLEGAESTLNAIEQIVDRSHPLHPKVQAARRLYNDAMQLMLRTAASRGLTAADLRKLAEKGPSKEVPPIVLDQRPDA